jgi:hypothetical protein
MQQSCFCFIGYLKAVFINAAWNTSSKKIKPAKPFPKFFIIHF